MARYKRAGLGLLSALIVLLVLGCTVSEDGLDVAVAVESNDGTTRVLIGVMKGLEPAGATVTVNGDVFVVDFVEYAPLTDFVSAGDLVTRQTPYPQQYIVKAFDTVAVDGYEALESGTATGHTIPANTLTDNVSDSKIVVGAMSTTSLGGDLSALSELTVVSSVNIFLDT